MNWSWSLLWIPALTLGPSSRPSSLSVGLFVFLCDWLSFPSLIWWSRSLEVPSIYLDTTIPLSLCNSSTRGRAIFIKWCHVLSLGLLLLLGSLKIKLWDDSEEPAPLSLSLTLFFFNHSFGVRFHKIWLWNERPVNIKGIVVPTREEALRAALLSHKAEKHRFLWTSKDTGVMAE